MENPSFLARHEFLIRRLHSLTGLLPVGAYMIVHLLTNAAVLQSPGQFQSLVYSIHSFGALLPVLEWVFIFLPILFHGVVGLVITRGAEPNSGAYPYGGNFRYTLQRATGLIAFLFIMWHVFHMHGWLHQRWWLENVAEPYFGAQFAPYNAASTAGAAMRHPLVIGLYSVGVLACVFHLANGIWTAGITWGAWVSTAAQRRACRLCDGFGVALAILAMAAVYGMATVDAIEAKQIEDRIFDAKIRSGEIVDVQRANRKRAKPAKENRTAEQPGGDVATAVPTSPTSNK